MSHFVLIGIYVFLFILGFEGSLQSGAFSFALSKSSQKYSTDDYKIIRALSEEYSSPEFGYDKNKGKFTERLVTKKAKRKHPNKKAYLTSSEDDVSGKKDFNAHENVTEKQDRLELKHSIKRIKSKRKRDKNKIKAQINSDNEALESNNLMEIGENLRDDAPLSRINNRINVHKKGMKKRKSHKKHRRVNNLTSSMPSYLSTSLSESLHPSSSSGWKHTFESNEMKSNVISVKNLKEQGTRKIRNRSRDGNQGWRKGVRKYRKQQEQGGKRGKSQRKINNEPSASFLISPENGRTAGINTTATEIAKGNFMAAPSIDYFVEKSSNYIDANDLPPFKVIGVSVKSPSKGTISTSAETENEMLLQRSELLKFRKEQKEKAFLNTPNGDLDEKPKKSTFMHMNHHKITTTKDDDSISSESDIRLRDADKNKHSRPPPHGTGAIPLQKGSIVGPVNELSCLKGGFQPAPEVLHADIKYLRNGEGDPEENAFLEAEYICHRGYKLKFNDTVDGGNDLSERRTNVQCIKGQWIGKLPMCVKIENFTDVDEMCTNSNRCEQLCFRRNGQEECSCHKGFRMKDDNNCEDINECIENESLCEYECTNTMGSYQCKCPKGLRLGAGGSCVDINECLPRNGRGPCQDTCINTWGGYKCACDSLSGSQLAADGHRCIDEDKCFIDNGGCSHTCLNTLGKALCLCPEGWVLDKDWKTCVDIDECAEQYADSSEQKCEFGCINTPGSYICLVDFEIDQSIHDDSLECPDGYYRNSTTEDCEDMNECSENNGGCYHRCINTPGSYHCSCNSGFVIGPTKYSCMAINSSTDISCPPLFPPKHGYLECSRPIETDTIGNDANGADINSVDSVAVKHHRITNRPGSQCVLRCPSGFRINGKFSKECSSSGTWIGESDGTCIRYPTPKLICPLDILLETAPSEDVVKLKLPRPKTDVNYDRDVTVEPTWLKNSEVTFEPGLHNITYTAKHPVSKLSVSCYFTVKVLRGEPPVVKFCPRTQKYMLSKQDGSIKIAWNEPIFWDNVNVTEISRTNNPGNSFGVGSHQIVYVAKDQAGFTARCVFKILVNVPTRSAVNQEPLPVYRMFYK